MRIVQAQTILAQGVLARSIRHKVSSCNVPQHKVFCAALAACRQPHTHSQKSYGMGWSSNTKPCISCTDQVEKMPMRIMLYSLQHERAVVECKGPMGCCKGDTFADLWLRLKAADVLDWAFQF